MSNYFPEIIGEQNIEIAIHSINQNGTNGPDGKSVRQAIEDFLARKDEIISQVSNSEYRIHPAQRIYMGEKRRPLDILIVQDRIVQRMVSQVLGAAYEPFFSNSSHGFRPGRGRHTAIEQALISMNAGYHYLLQLDISKYFQNINRSRLLSIVKRNIDEGPILSFIENSLSSGYIENNQVIRTEKGISQGSPLSPVLSNIYLNELDQELDSRNIPFIRFADDVLILTKTQEQAEVVKNYLNGWLSKNLDLTLSEEKTKVVTPGACHILGYKILWNEDKKSWECDPPLPVHKEKGNAEKGISVLPKGNHVEIHPNKALLGLSHVDASSYKNRWIPKDEATRIKNAVNSQFTVAEIATELGFTVLTHTADTLTLLEHDSCIIWPMTNKFKRFSAVDNSGRAVGGGPLDFYMHFRNVAYFQALSIFKDRVSTDKVMEPVKQDYVKKEQLTPLQRDLQLHDEIQKRNIGANSSMRNVFAYLIKTRMIDPEIVSEQVKRGCIQQVTDEKGRAQCVFIGRDENGLYVTACFRAASSTVKFMGDFPGCNYDYGWIYDPEWDQSSLCISDHDSRPDPTKQLLCFESYIEMLSYMTILKQQGFDYRKFSYLSCGSITKSQCIEKTCDRYGYQKVKVMFNNDREQEAAGRNPGKEAAERTVQSLKAKGLNAAVILPSVENDWNDTLVKKAVGSHNHDHKNHHHKNR